MNQFKSGLVTLSGRTNVGKSTLINQIMDTEIAIATHKPQTTRFLIKGVYEDDNSQIIFIDSPGMHKAIDQLGHNMQKSASVAIQEADLVLILVDARRAEIGKIEKRIIQLAQSEHIPMILIINKIDLIEKIQLLPIIQMYADYAEFETIIPISAKQADGIEVLLAEIKKALPAGVPIINNDSYTDQTERSLAAEYIRREIIEQISDEIPYQIAVQIDEFNERLDVLGERKRVQISASILCERDSHKMILVGKKGQQIAAIGKASREKIAEMLDCPCDLNLFVKVRDNWRNSQSYLKDLGYSSQDLN
ncbi:MAG: GTPase Era [Clostridiaceae bacterium]|nr:GTPase Era [Clostridiaceae bacterium]